MVHNVAITKPSGILLKEANVLISEREPLSRQVHYRSIDFNERFHTRINNALMIDSIGIVIGLVYRDPFNNAVRSHRLDSQNVSCLVEGDKGVKKFNHAALSWRRASPTIPHG